MDTHKNEMDDLLNNAMQFTEGEIPEPDKAMYNKLRKKVSSRKPKTNPFARLLNIEIKLYQAALAVTAVAVICLVFRPATFPQGAGNIGMPGSDTATAFKGSSLKSDSFLVKNFTSAIY